MNILFHDEEYYISQTSEPELFFKEEIQPRKEELEKWYFNKRSLYVDLMIIAITTIVVLKPTSNIAYKVFPDLPAFDLQAAVNQFTINNYLCRDVTPWRLIKKNKVPGRHYSRNPGRSLGPNG